MPVEPLPDYSCWSWSRGSSLYINLTKPYFGAIVSSASPPAGAEAFRASGVQKCEPTLYT